MVLTSLPVSLDATYQRILREIDKSCVDDAKRILTSLCFAKRPMTISELAVELGNSRLNLSRRLQDKDDIGQICPSFIDIGLGGPETLPTRECHGKARTVRIVHYSVQEFLESDRIRQQSMARHSMQSTISYVEMV